MAAYYHGMSLLRVLTVCAVVAACGSSSPRRVRKPGDEYLVAIRFEGVSLSHSGLLNGLALKRNLDGQRAIDEYQLGLDIERITGLYQRRGYFSAKVTPRVERKGDAQTLIFHVDEGPRATVSIVITGLPPEVPYPEARALVEVPNGAPFDYDLFDAAKAPLLSIVENAGYAHAQLNAQVLADRVKARATLRYAIDAGPHVVFGPVTVTGVEGSLADAAKARLPFREGDPYSTKQLAEAQQAIIGIGRFSSARVEADRLTDDTVVLPVKVTLTEAKPWEAKAGFGVAFDTLTYRGGLRGSLTHAGWPTPLTTLGVELRPELTVLRDICESYDVWNCELEPRIRAIGTITQQDFLQRDVKADVEGGLDFLKLEAYTLQGARVRLGISKPLLARRIEARVGWQFGYYTFGDYALVVPDPANPIAFVPDPSLVTRTGTGDPERLGSFTETIAVDLRDNSVTPHQGGYGELRFIHGGAYAGGGFDYVQVMPDLRGYLPLGRAVLAARAKLGVILGDVPPTERFYAGGASSQRGFPERHMSPFATGMNRDGEMVTVPIGGAAALETGIELRVPFMLFGVPMGAAAFLDGGDVTETPEELDPSHLHWAVGVSLRPIYLPIGPIRLDFAWRLNRTGAGEPVTGEHFNFVFSLGEAF
jgi:outer membrane translocation and assembly module TamA